MACDLQRWAGKLWKLWICPAAVAATAKLFNKNAHKLRSSAGAKPEPGTRTRNVGLEARPKTKPQPKPNLVRHPLKWPIVWRLLPLWQTVLMMPHYALLAINFKAALAKNRLFALFANWQEQGHLITPRRALESASVRPHRALHLSPAANLPWQKCHEDRQFFQFRVRFLLSLGKVLGESEVRERAPENLLREKSELSQAYASCIQMSDGVNKSFWFPCIEEIWCGIKW